MAMITVNDLKWIWIGKKLSAKVNELDANQQNCLALAGIFHWADDLARLEKEFEIEFAKQNSGISDQVWLELYKQIERGE